LRKTNFNDEEDNIRAMIEEKMKEKEMEISISGYIQGHLKEQTQRLQAEKLQWEKKKTDKDLMANNKKNDVKDRIKKKEDQIGEHKAQ